MTCDDQYEQYDQCFWSELHAVSSNVEFFSSLFDPMRRKKKSGKIPILIVSELKWLKKKVWWNPGLNYAGARLKSPRGKKTISAFLYARKMYSKSKKESRGTLSLAAVSIMIFKYNVHNMFSYYIEMIFFFKFCTYLELAWNSVLHFEMCYMCCS